MPRNLRVIVEGGIYHIYNRFASGEAVFADPQEALEFIELLRYVKKRDGWTVFAWVLMSNHYHLAIRSTAVPISRGLQHLQGRFSQRFNRGGNEPGHFGRVVITRNRSMSRATSIGSFSTSTLTRWRVVWSIARPTMFSAVIERSSRVSRIHSLTSMTAC